MYIEAIGRRKPIGVLMIEHRLIERALSALEKKTREPGDPPDVISLAELIDFFGDYADATHHGKEEDILFVEADQAGLSKESEQVLAELRDEHVRFRAYRRRMAEANRRLAADDEEALAELASTAQEFIPLLRQHIQKEDKIFFPAFDATRDPAQRKQMMTHFSSFDAERIHETYKAVVTANE